jgi:hypothetical protein
MTGFTLVAGQVIDPVCNYALIGNRLITALFQSSAAQPQKKFLLGTIEKRFHCLIIHFQVAGLFLWQLEKNL